MNKEDIKPLEELLDEVRYIDGFPIANDEDILKLSDPPYYTACPNPYINDFIEEHGTTYDPETDDYERKPFVGDVSEGKFHKIYVAHTYHTKVPHKAIMKFINHYSDEGDLIYDGFVGSGMTAAAANELNRKAIISDLSPIATFLSYNYSNGINIEKFYKEAMNKINKIKKEYGWMNTTKHSINNEDQGKLFENENKEGHINYIVWSDVLICPYCNNDYIFWEVAVDNNTGKVKKKYDCPHCDAKINKKDSKKLKNKYIDNAINEKVEQVVKKPVLINYTFNGERFEKKPSEEDLKKIKNIRKKEIPYWFPTNKLPKGYNTDQPKKSHGLSHTHHFFTKRNLWLLSSLWDIELSNKRFTNLFKWLHTASQINVSKLRRYRVNKGGGGLTGTLYCSSLTLEANVIDSFIYKLDVFKDLYENYIDNNSNILVSTNSITENNTPDNTIDYIFTDPPFGDNLMYSELNFIWESWLKVFTNNETEAIVNSSQNKNLDDYTSLMTQGFKEMYRILKPNRWMTVVFHNSKAKVWNAIQESITRAGFIIAQVSTLDKKQGSFKQVTSAGAVKNDLVINAYKPKKEFEDKFLKNAGEGLEADFVKEQLKHLPVGANIERTEQMLYSKMLAHYVENGFKIKYDANNFYKLLHDNFVELDGYWFLEDQADEYSEWKSSLKLDEIEDIKKGNQVLFVVDEKSALTWINNFLDEPKEYGEIYTSYEQIATQTDDKIPELRELLDQNFILEDGKYRRPKTRKERESIEKSRTKNLERAWKKLLDRAKNGSRKIKNIRKEALIYGFTKCYQQENYEDIVTVADRLYKSTLESSGDILDFVDIARMKTE